MADTALNGGGAIVTGGAQGIGRAVTERLLDGGMRVLFLDADSEAVQEARAELSTRGEAHGMIVDIAKEGDVAAAAAEAARLFEGGLDALVNNAGIMIRKPLAELSPSEWRRVLDVNLTGAFLCARAFAPMLARRRGAIVNIASTRARMSEPDTEAYAASKGGLVALTHALAVSLGPEVRVNCVSPGWIDVSAWKKRAVARQEALSDEDHRQHPAGRVGRPEDVAALVAWLLGAGSGFMTGAEIVLDGGMTRKMIYA